ncbi:MAG: tetratricopeptide repeat protein [Gammaproteobacteria bacterium]
MAGNLAYQVGRYAEAQSFLEKALQIREKALGPEHPHVAGRPGVALRRPRPAGEGPAAL